MKKFLDFENKVVYTIKVTKERSFYMKNLYGEVKLTKDELLESDAQYMELEYYKTTDKPSFVKEGGCSYGIEVIKNEYSNGEKVTESGNMNNITHDEKVLDDLLASMKKNKVTPCTLEDSVIEYLKSKELQD